MNRTLFSGIIVALTLLLTLSVAGPAGGVVDVDVTVLVSASSDGERGDSASWQPVISADGRHVVFTSLASNFFEGDELNGVDVFVHDLRTRETELVSVSTDGLSHGGGGGDLYDTARRSDISADGRYVAFTTKDSDLVPDDTNQATDVFVHDRETGVTKRVSVSSSGEQANDLSFFPKLSADGQLVAFTSAADNLVPGDTNGRGDVFVHHLTTGRTERVSVSSHGQEAGGVGASAVSADGRHVLFTGSGLHPDDCNGIKNELYLHDRVTGTTEIAVTSCEALTMKHRGLAMTPEARYVAFVSDAPDLVPGYEPVFSGDVFVADLTTGAIEVASVKSDGEKKHGQSRNRHPSISADGRYVAFESQGSLVDDDTNNDGDIYIRDRVMKTTTRASVNTFGEQGPHDSLFPSISADGSRVVFQSFNPNFDHRDPSDNSDVFMRGDLPLPALP